MLKKEEKKKKKDPAAPSGGRDGVGNDLQSCEPAARNNRSQAEEFKTNAVQPTIAQGFGNKR